MLISDKKIKEIYEKMLKIRDFEEKAMELFKGGEIP